MRDAPAAVGGTAEAVLAPVERVADAAVTGVSAVAEPVVGRVADVVPAPVAREAADVVTGALPGRAAAP